MAKYTVIGLWVGNDPVVARWIEGNHGAVDTDDFDERFNGRWATSVVADNPAEAGGLAVDEMAEGLE